MSLNDKDVVIEHMYDYQKGEQNLKSEDTKPYIPLEVLREDRISFPLNGSDLSVKRASAEDFLAFISGAVNVVNIEKWSIFMRWNAINVGLEAGTLIATNAEDFYKLALAKAEVFSTEENSDNPASQAG